MSTIIPKLKIRERGKRDVSKVISHGGGKVRVSLRKQEKNLTPMI